jgi:tetratricopeptide (TPR) repeat protein
MNGADVDELLRCFRRRMAYSVATRWLVILSVIAAFATPAPSGASDASKFATLWLTAVLLGWLLLVVVSIRTAKKAHLASALLSVGRLDEAEQVLTRVLKSFSIFRSTLLAAGQQLGTLLHARKEHLQAVKVFRTILLSIRSRLGRQRSLEATVRMQWADCELSVGNLQGVYEAIQPIYRLPLTLSERLMLLPIELRYDLAAGHTKHAVSNLREKMHYAELLDSSQAGWVHAMLAEACRREGMRAQTEFLRRRAVLYHDLKDLPPTWSMISAEPT